MDKLRKTIIKWLFGEDWEKYWDLHDKYCKELAEHRQAIAKNIELLEKAKQRIEKEQETLNLAKLILEMNNKLIQICKENGIDVDNYK